MYHDPSRDERLLTIPEAAARLQVKRHTLFVWLGNLHFVEVRRRDGIAVLCLRESLVDRIALLRRWGVEMSRAQAMTLHDEAVLGRPRQRKRKEGSS